MFVDVIVLNVYVDIDILFKHTKKKKVRPINGNRGNIVYMFVLIFINSQPNILYIDC